MSGCLRRTCSMAVLAILAGVSPAARGQELINRREQARRAFLATPAGIYRHYCAHCHGPEGRGDGLLWDAAMTPAPADLTALGMDQEHLVEAIRRGSAGQGKSNLCPPGERTIAPADLERLARYLLSLGPAGEEAAAAADEPPPAPAPAPAAPIGWALPALIGAETIVLGWLLARHRAVLRAPPAAWSGPVEPGAHP